MAKKRVKPQLTVSLLCKEAAAYAAAQSILPVKSLYGVTDGKAVGTYVEHEFRDYLEARYTFAPCNSAMGIDYPDIDVDMKVTSIAQPQSSCPFKNARQKIFGLGYGLLVFVYQKTDDAAAATSTLQMVHTLYLEPHLTADYQMTQSISRMLEQHANVDDLIALMRDRNLQVDDIEAKKIAEEILKNPPAQGYLTISNALQWRLQYGRAIAQAGVVEGIHKLQ